MLRLGLSVRSSYFPLFCIILFRLQFIWSIMIMMTAHAWLAEWIRLDSKIHPPRSGHVAFGLHNGKKVYVFGGYAEETNKEARNSMPIRYPINDLWEFDPATNQWNCVCTSELWKPEDSIHQSHSIPQQRLAAAAATCRDSSNEIDDLALVFGGWDSQEMGTGGVILNDIAALQQSGPSKDEVQWYLDSSWKLEETTSRLVAASINNDTILLHNHRCTNYVILVHVSKSEDRALIIKETKQPTTGDAPSPRGLHAATYFAQKQKLVIFGGAAQSGDMSDEVFVLDTQTWVWENFENVGPDIPSPRASPCLQVLEDSSTASICVLFGGADRSLANQGVGLHGCDDLWTVQLDFGKRQAIWEKKLTPTTDSIIPPGRNAATLTPILARDDSDTKTFLLQGGWYPFQTTHCETFILKLRK